MIKKLLSYALPLVAAAGIAAGCKPDKKTANIAHKQPKILQPARQTTSTVTIESTYADLPKDKNICLYDEYGLLTGIGSGIGETGFALDMTLVLQNPEGIKSYVMSSFDGRYSEEIMNCESMIDMKFKLMSPSKSYLERYNLFISITDCQGKTSKYVYTLEDIISKSKQFDTLIPAEDQKCPDMLR